MIQTVLIHNYSCTEWIWYSHFVFIVLGGENQFPSKLCWSVDFIKSLWWTCSFWQEGPGVRQVMSAHCVKLHLSVFMCKITSILHVLLLFCINLYPSSCCSTDCSSCAFWLHSITNFPNLVYFITVETTVSTFCRLFMTSSWLCRKYPYAILC